jgi:hypothetical protein
MLSRRTFVNSVGAGVLATSAANADQPAARRLRLAVVTTEWRDRSHAWHMAERFLHGYPINGRSRSKEFNFPIHKTIAEALRCGGDKLAVDAVLIIGEHGNYPLNKYGQKMYPRYEFFSQVVDVFRKDGRVVPIFNDKHLSWRWEWAREMVDTARKMNIPFVAGSSLPVTWRMPSSDLPHGTEVEEVMCLAMGGLDSYDFHALETIQCMAERRRGGERGVVALQALRGEPVWKALAAGSWRAGGWDPALFEACLCRSHTLAQPETFSHRRPTTKQMQTWVKDPAVYRFEYADGVKATMLLMNGLVGDFTFAARIKGQAEPYSTLFHLPPTPNVVYSAALMSKAEETFMTGKAPYPIERTLLTTGLVAAGMQSLGEGQKRLETPHLAIRYQVPQRSTFAQ